MDILTTNGIVGHGVSADICCNSMSRRGPSVRIDGVKNPWMDTQANNARVTQ